MSGYITFTFAMKKTYNQLNSYQRYQLAALLTNGVSKKEIAQTLEVHISTVYRELKRNSKQQKAHTVYKAVNAIDFSKRRKYRPKATKSIDKSIVRRLTFLLNSNWSPEQIAQSCKLRHLSMLSIEGIYLWIYKHRKTGIDFTNNLRRHHRKRRKRRLIKQPRMIIKDKKSIHDRPLVVSEQGRYGDFETDLVKCQNGYLVTITERKSLYNIIEIVESKEAINVQNAIVKALFELRKNVKTITSDNGTEFANHKQIALDLEVDWYFADAYKSQQRGCNENQNGLLRQYFKNDTDLNMITQEELKNIQNQLNSRPRKKLNYLTPKKILTLNDFFALDS